MLRLEYPNSHSTVTFSQVCGQQQPLLEEIYCNNQAVQAELDRGQIGHPSHQTSI